MFRRPASDSEGEEDDYGRNSGLSSVQMDSTLRLIMEGKNEESELESTSKVSESTESEKKEEIFTRDDLNKLAAKVMKAELKGDMEKAEKLKEKLEMARKQFEKSNSSTIMVEMDRRTGIAKPAGFKTKHDRARDAEHEMLTKFITSDKTEEEIKRKEDRRSRKRGPETEDDRFNKLRQKNTKYEKIIESCETCSMIKEKAVIAHQSEKFVFVVSKRNILDGSHFYIIPKEHYVSSVVLDEDYSEELNEYKTKLIQLYEKEEKSLIFFEISKLGRHLKLEVVPVEKYMINSCKRLLLNEFEMSNDETSARAYRDLETVSGGLKRAIADGIPYTWFADDNEAGYLHRLSRPDKFDDDFYYNVLGAELIEEFDDMQLAQKLNPTEVREKCQKLQEKLSNL